MRGKKAKCDFCGAPFEARRKNAKHCEACRAAIRRADSHAQYRLKTGKLAREDYRAAVEAEVRADVEERRRRAAANRPRCLYCGNVYSVNSSGYCATCRSTGLDSLHKETGRTNGWDRPDPPPRARRGRMARAARRGRGTDGREGRREPRARTGRKRDLNQDDSRQGTTKGRR